MTIVCAEAFSILINKSEVISDLISFSLGITKKLLFDCKFALSFLVLTLELITPDKYLEEKNLLGSIYSA